MEFKEGRGPITEPVTGQEPDVAVPPQSRTIDPYRRLNDAMDWSALGLAFIAAAAVGGYELLRFFGHTPK